MTNNRQKNHSQIPIFILTANSAWKQNKKKRAPPVLCIYVKGSHHFCVFAGGNVCIMSPLSLWWCAPHDFLESTKTTKQKTKKKQKKNSQPTKTRLHCFIAELSTVPLIARRASTYRPFEERALRSSHATLIRETKKLRFAFSPPPPVSLMFYQWFLSFKSFIIKIIRQTSK